MRIFIIKKSTSFLRLSLRMPVACWQQNAGKRNPIINMGKPLCYLCTLALVLIASFFNVANARSQQAAQITIKGTITDASNQPLTGATVLLKGTSIGTTSDAHGVYSLNCPNDEGTLIVSNVGYTTLEIHINGRQKIDVVLTEQPKDLNEVIVIGYGHQKRGDLTGAIASVKGDDLIKTGSTTLAQSMKGKVPGLSFSQTSSQPGAAVYMQIRGAAAGASPLVVVDGVPVSTMWEPNTGLNFGKGDKEGVFDNINPEDVKDIQVLKDASATSIYGSRAAGGVILITTKRGTEDGNTNISFKASNTVQWTAAKPPVLSAKDYMRASDDSQLERWVMAQGYAPWGTKELPPYDELVQLYLGSGQKWNYDPDKIASFTGGTNWYDAVTRNGNIQQYDFSMTGGNKNSSYLISFSRMGNDGLVKNNDYGRTSGRINFDHTFSKYVKGGVSATYSVINSDDAAISGSTGSTLLFQAVRKYDPAIPIRDSNGNYALGTIYGLAQNPASILDVSMKTKKENVLASAYIDITPIPELSLRTTGGYDRKFANTGSYFPATTQEGIYAGGIANIVNNDLSNYYFNETVTYSKIFAKNHSVKIMAGYEYQKSITEGMNAGNQGFPYDAVKWHNLGLGTYAKPPVGSSLYTGANASFISRLNYGYKDKYLLTANFRRDGSSNFAENKQWGNFGGVSLAWRINKEDFLKNSSWLSDLKLRLGAGITGNAGSLTGTETYYTAGHDYYFNNEYTSGIALSVIGNPNLSWESQQDVNIGLDFGLFKNRLSGTIDLYERTIKDRIGIKNLMSYNEVNTVNFNTARIDKTRGVDISLNASLINKNNFTWNSAITFTYYKDYTTKRDPSEVLDINNEYSYDWNEIWSYRSDGLVQPGETIPYMPGAVAGVVKIKDLNGYLYDESGNTVLDSDGRPKYSGEPDGKIDNADLVKIGNNTPMPFSWSNTFRYKNFDLDIYAYGMLNRHKNNDELVNISYGAFQGTNTSPQYFDRYTFNNLTSTIPAFTQTTNSTYGYGDYFMEKAWFIRLDNISLGYTLPKNMVKKVIRSLRIYATVRNLAVITPYKGLDPEYDVYMYPSVRSFSFGLDIKL